MILQAAPQAVLVQGQEPLTASMLAAAPPQEQKQMLGERLFPLIQSMYPDLAGKITGMLLEIDNSELLHMLESRESLKAKVGVMCNFKVIFVIERCDKNLVIYRTCFVFIFTVLRLKRLLLYCKLTKLRRLLLLLLQWPATRRSRRLR